MRTAEILVMSPVRDGAMAQLERAYVLHRMDRAADRRAFLADHGPACAAVVTSGHVPLTRTELAHLPNVELVACVSAGFDAIDAAALRDRGIALTNTSVALFDDVADTALMLTLAARRHLVAAHAHVASGAWGRKGAYPLLSAIRGKRAGILGLGQIGCAIAARFEPLGLEIGYCTRRPRDVAYRHFGDAHALAAWADILVVAVPGGAGTAGLVDARMIAALGPQGTLINIARGSVVDEPALIAALSSGRLGSAGLDVFQNEPDPDRDLIALPTVTLYPHHASGTVETRDAMAQLVVDNLAAHFAGRPLLTPVQGVMGQDIRRV